MEIKYTTDGKKVVVIGNLNSQEKIVQEVFIVNGNEIPSGENFVVKSLHDAPAISWKAKHIQEEEARYDLRIKELNDSLKRERERLSRLIDKVKAKAEFMYGLAETLDISKVKWFLDFVTGDIKWCVYGSEYSGYEMCEFENLPNDVIGYERGLRLVSLFGQSNGDLMYRIHQYSDNSGGYSSKSELHVFKTQEEALIKLIELNIAAPITDTQFKLRDKYNFTLDQDKLATYKASLIKSYKQTLDSFEKGKEDYASKISQVENL